MQMAKVEKTDRFSLSCEWDMTGIDHEEPYKHLYTKKFTYNNTELFRVGLKMAGKTHSSSNPVIFFLLTSKNLLKKGLRVLSVSFFKFVSGTTNGTQWTHDTRNGMEQQDLTTGENDGDAGAQLFTSHLKIFEITDNWNPPTNAFHITFMVNFIGSVNNFRIHQMDGLSSKQLWSSVTNKEGGTDFKLVANDGESAMVHKWLLAARSPVFAALFSSKEEITSLHLSVDCTVKEMKQFIKFIYTGELEGLVHHTLMQLAAKYQIKTLEDICQSVLQDASFFSDKKMALISWHLKNGSHLICNKKNEPDEECFGGIPFYSKFTCSWNVQNLNSAEENQETIKMRVSFEHGGKELFEAWLEMRKDPNNEEKYTFTSLTFLSHGHGSICSRIWQVMVSIHGVDQNSCSSHQKILMTRNELRKDDKEAPQLFTSLLPNELTIPISLPFVITFHVKTDSTVTNYINKPLDSTWSGELWAAAINRKMTDVEILVGEEAFGAHRSLLSARSPVFAAMFASGMKETVTGQVRIEDVDPTTFQRFLKFLYTGMLESSAMDEELFTVADKYQVATLMELSRPVNTTGDANDSLLQTYISCS